MSQKRWAVGVTAFLAVSLMLAGFVAFAAETGSQEDPALSASYITDEFQPVIYAKIDELVKLSVDGYSSDMTARIDALSAQVNSGSGGSADLTGLASDSDFITAVAAAVIEKLPASPSGGVASTVGGWAKVEVKNGKTLTSELGTEVMLRLGSATCVATGSPGLIDMTTGGDLANGKALEKNHHYVCTVAGRGIKASADVTIFVRGGYTIN